MLMCSYKASEDKVRIHKNDGGKRMWLVKVTATDGERTETRELHNKQRCRMSDMIEPALQAMDDIGQDMPEAEEVGFQVFRLR